MAGKAKKKGANNAGKKPASSGKSKGPGGPQPACREAGRRSKKRPGAVLALLMLTAVQAAGAIGGGVGLVRDPVNNIGLSTDLLKGTPFKDYLIPGLILLIVVGLFALLVLAGLLRHWKPAWWLSLASGGGLVIWIITEVALLGYLPGTGIGMQIGMAILGLAIVTLTLLVPTRRYYGIGA